MNIFGWRARRNFTDASGGPGSEYASCLPSTLEPISSTTVRRDLLKVVLRETLMRNGIPAGWLRADVLRVSRTGEPPRLHLRLLTTEWQPRLVFHAVGLEQDFRARLRLLDPAADQWLQGVSWQFALQDTSDCPSLPPPGSWAAESLESAGRGTGGKGLRP